MVCHSMVLRMLTELRLENWKSYQQATLYIDPIAVLIGVNASGKSNALDALQWLNRLAMGQSLTAALKGEGAQSAIRGGLEWAARQPGTQFTLSALPSGYTNRLPLPDQRCGA